MLTIEDLRNAKSASGFRQTGSAGGISGGKYKTGKPWASYTGSGRKGDIRFPRRNTPEEAAQDYCDYVNGMPQRTKSIMLTPTIDMGNKAHRHAPKYEKIEVVRESFAGPHDLYDVLIYDPLTGSTIRRKVGITATGHARYADICKTFGFSIKPHADAVTYPTKAAALAAEANLVSQASEDTDNWTPTGKESFAPAQKRSTSS